MADINDILKNMRASGKVQDMKSKGNLGEDAVLEILYERKQQAGNGLLFQSFEYPYQTNRQGICYTGNVLYENDNFVEYTKDTIKDEIDVLYITSYRMFLIEVKSYHAKVLYAYDHWFNRGSTPVDKSPILQAEKHARHFYHAVHDVIPDGNPQYIIPMCCFVDRCKIKDARDEFFRNYVPLCILNNLRATINRLNTPLEYNLALDDIYRKLMEVNTSIKKIL